VRASALFAVSETSFVAPSAATESPDDAREMAMPAVSDGVIS